MSNLGLLLNTNIINEFGLNKIKRLDSKEKNKILATALLVSVAIVVMSFYIFKLCFYLSDFLVQIDQVELLLVIGFIGTTLFTFATSLYKSSSYLFEAKDFDMLISLPIKESTILTSKVLMLVFSNYLISLGFMLIPAIVYFIKVDTSITYFLYLIILFLSTPLIPIVISSIISFFIGNISSKIKHKNLVMVVGSIIFLIGYMVLATKIETIAGDVLRNSDSIIEGISKLYPPAYYFVDALKNNNIVSLILFVLISIVPFLIFVSVFSRGFKNINSRMNESYKSKTYKLRNHKTSKPVVALLKKEISRYFSSYIYFLNSSIMIIILLIGTTGVLIFGVDKIDALLELNLDMNMIKPQISMMLIFVIIISCTTYCSISLEGKNLWILKSSPIEETDIFKAKIFMNLLLNMPIPLLCFILIGFKLKLDLQFMIIMSCAIITISILVSISGLLANLFFPNLDWKNEVAVVKRSIAMIVNLISVLIYIGILILPYYLLKFTNINIILISVSIITLFVNILIWNIIKVKGVKMFRSL